MPATLLLVDAYSQIYRAFFAIRSLSSPDGKPVNAIFGFTKMLRKLLADFQPTHVAVVFDLGPPAQRLAVLPSYKEQRPPTPPDLDAQLPAIREVLAAMCLPIVELHGEEADDLIATLAAQSAAAGSRVLIASTDKDFMQIVSAAIQVVRPDGTLLDEAGVHARYGVAPTQMADFQTLLGDAVDNIPGVPGVGEKTAAEFLQRFGTLDNLLSRREEIGRPKLREAIASHLDRLERNRSLVTLNTRVPLAIGWRDLSVRPADNAKLAGLFRQFGFKSLTAEVEKPQPVPDLFGKL